MPRLLSMATLAAAATTLLLMLGGGRLEALASDLDPLAEISTEEYDEMISENEQRPEEHRGPQLEGSATEQPDPRELDRSAIEQAVQEIQVTKKVVEHPKITGLVRVISLPELLRRIRATAWQREAITQILQRATLEMRLLRDVRGHEGMSWNELNLEIRAGRLAPKALVETRAGLARFHGTRIAGTDETFEEAAQLIKQDAIERISDLLDTDQDRRWRSADKRWALRALSFIPTLVHRTCCLGTLRRAPQQQTTS